MISNEDQFLIRVVENLQCVTNYKKKHLRYKLPEKQVDIFIQHMYETNINTEDIQCITMFCECWRRLQVNKMQFHNV